MKGSFLDISLLFIVVCFVGVYCYQNNNKSNSTLVESETASNELESNAANNNANNNTNNNANNVNQVDIGSNIIKQTLGPVHNFHQQFMDQNKKVGWNNWWSRHKSNYQVEEDSNFHGTSVRNYLNNMDSTNNIYV